MKRSPGLARDERGAVMLTGLFMAFVLASATWFVFGTAKALVFRERVQETADAAAFSAAVIHAKGMNLIAAINLILFAVTAVWLTLRIFEHGMYLVQSTVTFNASNCEGRFCRLKACEISPLSAALTASGAGGPAAACQAAHGLQEIRKINKEARQSIGDGMWNTFPYLSKAQDATARLVPAAATATSLAVGDKFGHLTIAVSPSLVPVDDIVRLSGKNPPVDKPLGLPVINKTFGSLCNRAATVGMRKVKNAFRLAPGLGAIIDVPIVNEVIDRLIGMAAGKVETSFCSADDWAGHSSQTKIFREIGPKGMFPHAENGTDLMQVWAFTHGTFTDLDQKKVEMGATKGRSLGLAAPSSSNWYVAQAEMFFDCNGGWGDAQCNGDDHAIFSMRWRARLRRMRSPQFGKELGRYLRDALFSGPVKESLRKRLDLPGAGKEPPIDLLFDKAWDWTRMKFDEKTGLGPANTNGPISEIVH
jgi:hypothetical protein